MVLGRISQSALPSPLTVSVLPAGIVNVIDALTVTLLLIVTSSVMVESSLQIVEELSSVAVYAVKLIPCISPITIASVTSKLSSLFLLFCFTYSSSLILSL
jgi:hypothetical protein